MPKITAVPVCGETGRPRMLRRIAGTVCSVAFAALALVVLPGVAAATTSAATSPAPSSPASPDPSDYPAQGPLLTVTSGTVKVGGSVTVTGRGFHERRSHRPLRDVRPGKPRARIRRTSRTACGIHVPTGVAAATAHAVAASDGEFSAEVPLTQPGNATITATGERSHMSGAATVSVLSATTVAATKSTKHTLPLSKIALLSSAS